MYYHQYKVVLRIISYYIVLRRSTKYCFVPTVLHCGTTYCNILHSTSAYYKRLPCSTKYNQSPTKYSKAEQWASQPANSHVHHWLFSFKRARLGTQAIGRACTNWVRQISSHKTCVLRDPNSPSYSKISYHSLTLTLYLALHTGHDDMVVKQVTVHGLASQPNQPDAIRQALREFEDDLHTGADGNPFEHLLHILQCFHWSGLPIWSVEQRKGRTWNNNDVGIMISSVYVYL